MYDEQTYVAARAAMLRAVADADAFAARCDRPASGAMWHEDADNHLYDQHYEREIDDAVYRLALELLAEEGRRRLELSNRSGGC